MRNTIIGALTVLLLAAPAMANDSNEGTDAGWSYIAPMPGPVWDGGRDVIYDNGPIITGVGTGFDGADESILQSVSLGMNSLGYGHQYPLGYQVADDFVVPAGETWDIDTITFFAYQTNSPTNPSPFLGVYFEIHAGDYSGPVVAGDMAVNALTTSEWTGIYRVTEATTGEATNRPIMANVCTFGNVSLSEGMYTIVWMADGELTSGPWVPPITIVGEVTTGNALQSLDGGASFADLLDSGTATVQGLPFILSGSGGTPTGESTWGDIKALYR